MRGRPLLRARFDATPIDQFATSAVVEAELAYGTAKGGRSVNQTLQEFLGLIEVLPFDSRSAEEYGQIRAHLEFQGQIIGPNDLFIAATALVHDLTLVTHNMAGFSRVPGLRVEDWE